ncbi:hypothetical protein GI364_04395 [Alicyclobacillus sp. SO9]|nr:hypothetical protein GI364_04395 [Alicyclobacillus sp. SO9]
MINEQKKSLKLLESIGLFSGEFGLPKLNTERIEEFATRVRSFDWVHMGKSSLNTGALISVLESDSDLLPPRSGHIGNWSDIAHGRAGMIDYNKAICAEKNLGYALIYSFNQTETDDVVNGDWIYLPGSIVEGSNRQKLPLYTWNGSEFTERDRNRSYFTPFVFTESNNSLESLVTLHWKRMSNLKQFNFKLEASVVWENREIFQEMIKRLIIEAQSASNKERALSDIISHVACLDGQVSRCNIISDGTSYKIGGTYFKDINEVVNAMLIPFLATVEPLEFADRIPYLPDEVPVMSNNVVSIISAIFNTHYPSGNVIRATMTQPCNPHFHWGALGMAGYPPLKTGYFSEKSSIKSTKKICNTLVNSFMSVDPIYFVLMPASIFTICPTTEHKHDVDLVEDMLKTVLTKTDCHAETDILMNQISSIVSTWIETNQKYLSEYYMNRFSARRSVLNKVTLPTFSETVEPPSFRRLSLRQNSMVVGALIESLNERG